MATGSGKTLLMHANILQYQHYLEKHGRRRELNRIILLTPNEGLSQQHLREFEAAGIDAELFNKDGRGLFTGQAVEILDVTTAARRDGRQDRRHRRLRGQQPGAGGRGASWRQRRRGRRMDALPQRALREGLLVRVLGHLRAGGQGQAQAHRPLRQEHPVRLLVPLLLRRRLRQGLPDPEPRRGDAAEPPRAVSGRLPAVVLPAAAALPRAGRDVPPVQHREAAVDLRRRQRDGDAGHAGCLGHRRDPAVPGPLRGRPRGQHPAHRARAEHRGSSPRRARTCSPGASRI